MHRQKTGVPHAPAKGPAGQSLVELAFLFAFMIILMGGVLDLGRLFYIYLAVYSSAQEGATFVCSFPTCVNNADCANPNNMEYRLRHENEVGLIDWSMVGISLSPSNPGHGDLVTVQVEYNYFMVAPIVSALAPGGLPLTGTASCRVIGT